MIRLKFCITTLTLSPILLIGYCSSAQAQAQKQKDFGNPSIALLNPRRLDRADALQIIMQNQLQLKNALLANLATLIEKPDGDNSAFESPFHLTVFALGTLKVEGAVGDLMTKIAFRLDPATLPQGGLAQPADYYPVAVALSRIGGREVISEVFNRFRRPADEQTLRAGTWILKEILGKEIATIIVTQNLGDITKRLSAPDRVTNTNPEKENLNWVKQLLEGQESILENPLLKLDTPTNNRTIRVNPFQ